MERIGIGQDRMSHLVITQSNINTYAHYWTYLDDVDDINKEAMWEGLEQPPGGALKEGARTYEMAVAPIVHSTFNRETNWRIITS